MLRPFHPQLGVTHVVKALPRLSQWHLRSKRIHAALDRSQMTISAITPQRKRVVPLPCLPSPSRRMVEFVAFAQSSALLACGGEAATLTMLHHTKTHQHSSPTIILLP